MDPFYCMYWSQKQQLIYKKAHKQDPNCAFTVDATDGIGKKLRLPNDEKSVHFYMNVYAFPTWVIFLPSK